MSSLPIVPPNTSPLLGTESFKGLEATVNDFWRFAMSDLRNNSTRGILVEFLIARALGLRGTADAWGAHDLVWDGISINIKSSAYLQAWPQAAPSRIVFSGLHRREYSAESNSIAAEPDFHSDVYVFAVHGAKKHVAYDPLDATQWMFYVLPQSTVRAIGQNSISLSALTAIGAPSRALAELPETIRRIARAEKRGPFSREELETLGFTGFVRLSDLDDSVLPRASGVYVILRESADEPDYLSESGAGRFKGRDPSVDVEVLRSSWVPGAHVVYIGKADAGVSGTRGLRTRLREYRRHGAGDPVGHWGGRYIWQLADHAELLVAWLPTGTVSAAQVESTLLSRFIESHRTLPFANLRR